MKKILGAFVATLSLFAASAQAALVNVPFQFRVNFVDAAYASDLGVIAGNLFSGVAIYDNALPTVPSTSLFAVDSLTMTIGSRTFTNTDDLFGGALIGVGPTSNLTALLFEANVTLTAPLTAGLYLLSFNGVDMQFTPSGNTFDNKMTASAVPIPAALPLLAAGLGVFGFLARRRRAAE